MSRFLAGGVGAMLLIAAGLFWWQSRAAGDREAVLPGPPPAPAMPAAEELPRGDPDAIGEAPSMPASATPEGREQRRFARYDRDRDGVVTRGEMLGSRVKAFKALDRDGNNLLSFEEWAVATTDRFAAADGDRDGRLTPKEFAASAPKPKPPVKCRC